MILEAILAFLVFHLLLGIILWLYIRDVYDGPSRIGSPVFGNLYYFYSTLVFRSLNNGFKLFSKWIDESGKGFCFHWLHGSKHVSIACPLLIEQIALNPHLAEKPRFTFSSLRIFLDGVFSAKYINNDFKNRKKNMNMTLKPAFISGPCHQYFVKTGKQLIVDLKTNESKLKENLEVYCSRASATSLMRTHAGVTDDKEIPFNTIKGMSVVMSLTQMVFANPVIGYIIFSLLKYIQPFFLTDALQFKELMSSNIDENVLKEYEQKSLKEQMGLPLASLIVLNNKLKNVPWEQSKKELLELISVGSHSSGIAMNNAISFFATSPEIQEKAWKEQFEIFGSDTRDPTSDDVANMKYLERFVKEVLRFSSPGMITRYARGDIVLDDTIIPAGTTIIFLALKIRMDPRFWKNPEELNPDRFLEEDKLPKYANFTFGFGIRICPAAFYSMYMMKVLLSLLIRKYKLTSTKQFKDLEFVSKVMVELKNHPDIKLEERNSSHF